MKMSVLACIPTVPGCKCSYSGNAVRSFFCIVVLIAYDEKKHNALHMLCRPFKLSKDDDVHN